MVRFEWNEKKNGSNRSKHGIDFKTARLVFEDPAHIPLLSNLVEGEERWTAPGSADGAIVLAVVHTYWKHLHTETIRIISARRATKHEMRLYEQTFR